MKDTFSLWVYLSQSPLLWLTVTLLVYATTDRQRPAHFRSTRSPASSPASP